MEIKISTYKSNISNGFQQNKKKMNLYFNLHTTFKSKTDFILTTSMYSYPKISDINFYIQNIFLQTLKIKHVSRKTNVGFWLFKTIILTKQNQNFWYYQPTGSEFSCFEISHLFSIPQQTFLLEGVLQKMKVYFS